MMAGEMMILGSIYYVVIIYGGGGSLCSSASQHRFFSFSSLPPHLSSIELLPQRLSCCMTENSPTVQISMFMATDSALLAQVCYRFCLRIYVAK